MWCRMCLCLVSHLCALCKSWQRKSERKYESVKLAGRCASRLPLIIIVLLCPEDDFWSKYTRIISLLLRTRFLSLSISMDSALALVVTSEFSPFQLEHELSFTSVNLHGWMDCCEYFLLLLLSFHFDSFSMWSVVLSSSQHQIDFHFFSLYSLSTQVTFDDVVVAAITLLDRILFILFQWNSLFVPPLRLFISILSLFRCLWLSVPASLPVLIVTTWTIWFFRCDWEWYITT